MHQDSIEIKSPAPSRRRKASFKRRRWKTGNRRKQKMKKHYFRMALVIDLLVLVAFVIGLGFYTYVTANKEMDSSMKQVKLKASMHTPYLTEEDDAGRIIRKSYSEYWRNAAIFSCADTGFYSQVVLRESGEVIDSLHDYAYIYKYEDAANPISYENVRVFAVSEISRSVDRHLYAEAEFDAKCDDAYIFDGSFTQHGKTYAIADIGHRLGSETTVEAWRNGSKIFGEVVRLGETAEYADLNKEAKELFNEMLDSLKNGKLTDFTKENLKTSYYCYRIATPLAIAYGFYAFHPLKNAVKNHLAVYVVAVILLVFVEVVISVVIKKLCNNRLEYENRSRNLTMSIAHELKTPLAVAKAYVENWEYIDEKDRAEYAEKISREVDDMSALISALLEMDKIDAGKISLNLEEIDLAALVRTLKNRISPLASERGLAVDIINDKDDYYIVKADPKLIKIAIGNYLTNAVKYAATKASVMFGEHGGRVRLEFRNDNAADNSAKTDRIENSGIGLTINENILKLHKAECGSNTSGKESVFWFEMDKA